MSRKTKPPRKPRLLSLCSGIGGIDLAWEMAGGEVAGQCEIDEYCQQVLAKHWPDVQRVADIRNVWGDSFNGPIDLIAGGIPCQPWSVAGLRRGTADQRHLWPEMRRIIAIYQPAWVLVENVAGFARLALNGVLTDLGADGYEAGAIMVPAASVGAPHLRERVFIVAHTTRDLRRTSRHDRSTSFDGAGAVADASISGRRQKQSDLQARQSNTARCGNVEYASGAGCEECDPSRVACDAGYAARRCVAGNVADDDRERPQRDVQLHGATQAREQVSSRRQARGRDADDTGQRQTESALGREPDGLSRRLDGTPRDDSDFSYPYQPWPAGPGDAQHEWEPPRVTQERTPNRAARLKALGNAVVPAQVYPVLAAIIEQWRTENEVSA